MVGEKEAKKMERNIPHLARVSSVDVTSELCLGGDSECVLQQQ